jgi:hypothetical protein
METSWTFARKQMKCGTVRDDGHTYEFYFIRLIVLFDEAFKYGDGAKL